MSRKLTAKQQAFRTAYIRSKTKNATQAARAAGYKDPNNLGPRLTKVPAIAAAIEASEAVALQRAEITAEKILSELWRVASLDIRQAFKPDGSLKDIHDMPEDVARAIAGVDVDELFEGVGRDRTRVGDTKKIRFWNKVAALELLGKHKQLFGDVSPLSGVPLVINIVPANNFSTRNTGH